MTRLRRLTLVPLAATAALIGLSAPHAASVTTSGIVTRVLDGDTVFVDVAGDGTPTPVAVRNAGLQTMELGQCHSKPASAAMTRLALGKPVTLAAASAASKNSGRLLRFVQVRAAGGKQVDTQLAQIRAGHALWYPLAPEVGRARQYHLAMRQAAAAGKNLWDPDYCGAGPQQAARLKMWINYDADGSDVTNRRDEWVRLQNLGTTPVRLDGWHLRTAAPKVYRFPRNSVVQPGKTLTVSVGAGTRTATWQFWNYRLSRFPNLENPDIGGGAYVFDPQGDLRFFTTYPCVYRCADPAIGKVGMTAQYDEPGVNSSGLNGEFVTIYSLGETVDLSNRVLQIRSYTHDLGPDVTVSPGRPLRIYVGSGKATATRHYWGKTAPLLPNTGGSAVLRSSDAIRIACTSWLNGNC